MLLVTLAKYLTEANGSVDTLLAQYEISLTNLLQQSSGGERFWGDART